MSGGSASLPDWLAGGSRQKRDRMSCWLNEQLDNKMYEDSRPTPEGSAAAAFIAWRSDPESPLREALEAAQRGNVEPLRNLYPQIARFINPPKLRRGEHFKKNNQPGSTDDPRLWLACAIEDAAQIRAISQSHYGRKNRPRGEATAEKIAADRWDLTEDEVRKKRPAARELKAFLSAQIAICSG